MAPLKTNSLDSENRVLKREFPAATLKSIYQLVKSTSKFLNKHDAIFKNNSSILRVYQIYSSRDTFFFYSPLSA